MFSAGDRLGHVGSSIAEATPSYGLSAGGVLALLVRLHRGPRRVRRVLRLAGCIWAALALGLFAVAERASEGMALLFACGVTSMTMSHLCSVHEAVPRRERRQMLPIPSRHARRRGALILLGPGLVLGLAVLERVIPPMLIRTEWRSLAIAGVAPAVLAALVGAWSMPAKMPSQVATRALFASIVAGGVCAPLTYLLLVAARWALQGELHWVHWRQFIAVSSVGGIIGAVIGGLLGAGFAVILAAAARLSRGAFARDLVRALGAGAWLLAGAVVLAVDVWAVPAPILGGRPDLSVAQGAALVVMAVALVVGIEALRRLFHACRLLHRARRGTHPQYVVVRASDLDIDDASIAALPAYLPFGRLDGVLVRKLATGQPPFRDGSVSDLLARVPAR